MTLPSRLAACFAILAAVGQPALAGDDKSVEARNKAIEVKLGQKPVLDFKNTPLQDVLKFIKSATQSPNDNSLPIYVDPASLEAAHLAITAPVSIQSKPGETLGASLKRLLAPLGLTYRIDNGLLKITRAPLGYPARTLIDREPQTRRVRAKLEEKIALSFKDAPLEDVLRFVKTATKGPNDSGIPIYVDPVGLQEAEVTLTTPVSVESRAGETLGASLKRALATKGLAYVVKDGLLTITSKESVDEPLPVKP